MKDNTYIVPNYKYGLIECPETTLLSFKRYKIDDALGDNNCCVREAIKSIELDESIHSEVILPFEEVDGLTIKDLKDYPTLKYKNRFLVFVMGDSLPLSMIESYSSSRIEKKPIKRSMLRFILLIDTEQYENQTIDDVIENYLTRNLDQMNLQNRKKALSFLEKYIHGNKENVMSKVNEYFLQTKEYDKIMNYSDYIDIPKRLIKNRKETIKE